MEGEVVGKLERVLVAGQLGDGVAALAIPDIGVGDGIVIEGSGLLAGFVVRLRLRLRLRLGLALARLTAIWASEAMDS